MPTQSCKRPIRSVDSPWLRAVTPSNRKGAAERDPPYVARVVFFPWAGGGPSCCKEWASPLSAQGVQLYVVSLPGRGGKAGDPFTASDPTTVVSQLVQEVSELSDLPLAFFGHSIGAVLAFQVARAALAAGSSVPKRVFVSGHVPPDVCPPGNGSTHQLPEKQLIEQMRQWGALSEDVLRNSELLEVILPSLRADLKLTESIPVEATPECGLPLALSALGSDNDVTCPVCHLLGWARFCSAPTAETPFRSRIFTGDHFYLREHQATVIDEVLETLRWDGQVPALGPPQRGPRDGSASLPAEPAACAAPDTTLVNLRPEQPENTEHPPIFRPNRPENADPISGETDQKITSPEAGGGGAPGPGAAWVVPVLPRGGPVEGGLPEASWRLVFFPWAGGSAAGAQAWALPLARAGAELHAVSLPGHGARLHEAALGGGCMGRLLRGIAGDLLPLLDKPTVFLGHSAGAILAFQMARHLEESDAGKGPIAVYVSSHVPPPLLRSMPRTAHLDREEFLREIQDWGAMPAEILEDAEMLDMLLPGLRADLALVESSDPSAHALSVPVEAFGGAADSTTSPEQLEQWRACAQDPASFQAHVFPGGHFYLQEDEEGFLEVVVRRAAGLLEQLKAAALEQSLAWNAARVQEWPADVLVHQLCLEHPARRTPHLPAVEFRGEVLSFAELNRRADQLAAFLQGQPGWRVGAIAGLFLEHCPLFVVAFFGILKAGGAYMALDLATSPDVLDRQVAGSGMVLVLTTSTAGVQLRSRHAPVLVLDELWDSTIEKCERVPPPAGLTGDSLAFCVCSSGTTGTPKVMLNPHRLTTHSVHWRQRRFPLQPGESAASHVFFVWELTRPLAASCCLHIIDDDAIYDPEALIRVLQRTNASQVLLTPSLLQQVLDSTEGDPGLGPLSTVLPRLRMVLLCGEVVLWELVQKVRARLPAAELYSEYSISECGTVSMGLIEAPPQALPAAGPSPPLLGAAPTGLPDPNIQCYILDDAQQPVPMGFAGELYIGGPCLSNGYLNMEKVTRERFLPCPWSPGGGQMFRTGDGARFLPGGAIEVLGRVAFMVKLRGYSIVPTAVETAINSHPGVSASVVQVHGSSTADQQLVAYYVAATGAPSEDLSVPLLREFLRDKLSSFEIPTVVMRLEQFPVNVVSGKMDLKALPKPPKQMEGPKGAPPPAGGGGLHKVTSSPAMMELTCARRTGVQQELQQIWQQVLNTQLPIAPGSNFFDAGGHSLLIAGLLKRMKAAFGVTVSVMDFFKHPSLEQQAAFVLQKQAAGEQPSGLPVAVPLESAAPSKGMVVPAAAAPMQEACGPASRRSSDLLLLGHACRFAGADTPHAFWGNLAAGVESVRQLSPAELAAAGVPKDVYDDPNFVPATAALDDVHSFDAKFFHLSKAEVALMDPQHRLVLEGSWEALEDWGHVSGIEASLGGSMGVFGGVFMNTYLHTLPPSLKKTPLQLEVGNDKDYVPTRVSYLMNFTGPSVAVQTSCSTSLSAVATAAAFMAAGHCRASLVAVASLILPSAAGYLYQEGMPESRDGHCRPFDAAASGTMFGDGMGALVLRPGAGAGDLPGRPLARICGIGINNDGCAKVGFTAPSVEGQIAAIMAAFESSGGASPHSVKYVEAHGTGTIVGDPIELAALSAAYARLGGEGAPGRCCLGSVKANIAHANIASGMSGLIKTVHTLQHRTAPPQINFSTLNPAISLGDTPFRISTQATPLEAAEGHILRAGVSNFGVGGTNVHMLLEECPAPPAVPPAAPLTKAETHTPREQLVVLSAPTRPALASMSARLATFLAEDSSGGSRPSLEEIAWTLQSGRRHYAEHRFAAACWSKPQLQALLSACAAGEWTAASVAPLATELQPHQTRTVGIVFGERWCNSAQEVTASLQALHDPLLKAAAGLCSRALKTSAKSASGDAHMLCLQLACGRLLRSHSVPIGAVSGEGAIGMLCALHTAEVLSLEDVAMLWECIKGARSRRQVVTWHPGTKPRSGSGSGSGSDSEDTKPGSGSSSGSDSEDSSSSFVMVSADSPGGAGTGFSDCLARCQWRAPVCAVLLAGEGAAPHFMQAGAPVNVPAVTALLEAAYSAATSSPLPSSPASILPSTDRALPGKSERKSGGCAAAVQSFVQQQEVHILVTCGVLPQEAESIGYPHWTAAPPASKAQVPLLPLEQDPALLAAKGRPAAGIARGALAVLQGLWLRGVALAWPPPAAPPGGCALRPAHLPTYPFQREVITPTQSRSSASSEEAAATPPGGTADTPHARQPLEEKLTSVADWMHYPTYELLPEPALPPPDAAADKAVVLVFGGTQVLAGRGAGMLEEALLSSLTLRGHCLILVELSAKRISRSPPAAPCPPGVLHSYTIREAHLPEDTTWLLEDLAARGSSPSHVVHMWSLSQPATMTGPAGAAANVEAVRRRGWHSLVCLSQAVEKLPAAIPALHVSVVTNDMLAPGGGGADPAKALLWGPLLVAGQEQPHVTMHLVDVQVGPGSVQEALFQPMCAFPGAGRSQEEEDEVRRGLAAAVAVEAEMTSPGEDFAVALRYDECTGMHARWRHTYRAIPLRSPGKVAEAGAQRMSAARVVLITGGLGRVGLALAEKLLSQAPGKEPMVVLLSTRAAIPPRATWRQALDDEGAGQCGPRVLEHMRNVLALEERCQVSATGNTVAVLGGVEVDDVAGMRALVARIRRERGGLHAVLHLAGLADLKYLPDASVGMLDAELGSKVGGVVALEGALRGVPELRAAVLFSSMAAVLGGYGMVAYTAANSFMDSFVRRVKCQAGSPVWRSVNWDDWDFEYGKEQVSVYEKTAARFAMSVDEGWEALQLALGLPLPQVLVTTRRLEPRLQQWRHREYQPRARAPAPAPGSPRSSAPAELQAVVLAAFRRVMLEESLGAHDDLFDSGGDSLTAAELLQELRRDLPPAYSVHLTLREIMANPSVDALLKFLQSKVTPTGADGESAPCEPGAGCPAGPDDNLDCIIRAVQGVYSHVLMDDALDPDSDLFDAGGDSLTASEVLQELRNVLPSSLCPHLSLKNVLAHSSARSLATFLLSQLNA